MILAFVLLSISFQTEAKDFFTWLRPWITSRFDWVFMIAGNIFVLFALALIISPWGHIKLGGPDAKPDFSYLGWFAMLFAAGMGIGLIFFGVLEPVFHFREPPLGVDGEDLDAARSVAIAATIFHWGLHPWAIYGIVALSLAFAHYNLGLPLTIRSAFKPLIGDRINGWAGDVIDVLAVLATLFGLATSLGLGAEQVAAGLNYLFAMPVNDTTKVLLICAITSMALVSVVAGLEAGVKRLSELNMVVAILLLAFVIAIGPTLAILSGFFTNLGNYAYYLPALSNWIGRPDAEFMHGWTTFYWAWWIAWSPFVGLFIARVSRGRTVREFIVCVLIIPTLASVLWMTAMGETAISQFVDDGYAGVVGTITNWQPELSLFKMLDPLPFGAATSFVAIVLIVVFFVTSSDSASLVIDTITSGGNPDPPTAQRVFWAITEGLVAIALLLGGGLAALQAASISMGLPFAFVLVAMCLSLAIGLNAEQLKTRSKGQPTLD